MEKKALSSDKIFDLMKNPFKHAKQERESLESLEKGVSKTDTKQGFAERRSK